MNDCPNWKKFLSEVMPNAADQAALQRFFRSCLVDGDKTIGQPILFAYGPGVGKSTIANVLIALAGKEFVSSIPLPHFAKSRARFPEQNMFPLKGKLVNISPCQFDERPAYTAKEMSAIKLAIDGDYLIGRELYAQHEEVFRVFAKHYVMRQTRPQLESYVVLACRCVLIEMTFRPETLDYSMTYRLLDEIEGIREWALTVIEAGKER